MTTSPDPVTHREGMKPGQDIIVVGYIGLSGTSVAVERKEGELSERFTKRFVGFCRGAAVHYPIPEEAICRKAGAKEYEPVGEGGIMAALWNLFKEYGLGFEIELRTIPVLQETIEICEFFDLNPYRLSSEGCAILAADNGGDLVRYLEKKGLHGVVIGKVEAGIRRQILNGEIRSFLDRPKPDELNKIN